VALSNPFTDGSLDSTDEKEVLEEGEPKCVHKEGVRSGSRTEDVDWWVQRGK